MSAETCSVFFFYTCKNNVTDFKYLPGGSVWLLSWSTLEKLPIAAPCFRPHLYHLAWWCPALCHTASLPSSRGFTLFSTLILYLGFSRKVFAQSDSPPVWLLTFPVKEPYCWLLIPLHPSPHKTILSIASTEYVHRLVSQSGRHHNRQPSRAVMPTDCLQIAFWASMLTLSL